MKYSKESLKIFTRKNLILIGLILVLMIGLVDYATGYHLGFFIFYLLPISFVAWVGGLYAGIILSICSALVWLLADYFARVSYPSILIPVWNISIRLTVFLIMVYGLWYIRIFQERTKRLTEFIVHDLRTPLINISITINNLLEIENAGLSDQQKDMLSSCKISTSRAFVLINSILDLSRLENRKMAIKITECDLGTLLDYALEEVSVFAKKREVKLTKQVDVKATILYTDRELMARVLVNILSNAIKVSPSGSVVSITAAVTTARLRSL